MEMLQTPVGIPIGLYGQRPSAPQPTTLFFAATLHSSLTSDPYLRAIRLLHAAGRLVVAIDLPCHGTLLRDGEPEGMPGWRARIEQNDAVLPAYCRDVSAILDYLVREGISDPGHFSAFGVSRGGFTACHLAAREPRIRHIAAVAPLTFLPALREFDGLQYHALTRSLSLVHLTEHLADRALWISIGCDDLRVDTEHAIRFARQVVETAIGQGIEPNVELHVFANREHSVPETSYDLAAQWLLER